LILKGEAWISIDGDRSTYQLKAGDCLLTTGGKPFVMAKDLSIEKKVKFKSLFKTAKNGVLTVNEGGDFFSVGTTVSAGLTAQILARRKATMVLDETTVGY
jgi:Cupin